MHVPLFEHVRYLNLCLYTCLEIHLKIFIFQKLSAKDRQKYEELQKAKKRKTPKKKTQTAVGTVKTEELSPTKGKKKSATVVCSVEFCLFCSRKAIYSGLLKCTDIYLPY